MKQFIVGIFLFISVPFVYSQKGKTLSDSDYLILQEKARALLNSDIDSSFYYAGRIELSDNLLHKSFAYGIKSYLYQLKGNSQNSDRYYKLAFALLHKLDNSLAKNKIKSYLLNFGGLIDWKNKRYNDALDKFIAGNAISKSLGDEMQVVKFNNNLSLIYSEIGNFKAAILMSKRSDNIVDKIQNQYLGENFIITKSNNYLRLGMYYEKYYKANTSAVYLLDSALFYYQKSIKFSKNSISNRIKCQIQTANILYMKQDIVGAEEMYLNVLNLAKENYQYSEYYTVLNNLGDLYFYKKENQKALACFKKVDSIYLNTKNSSPNEYINSNFYQAKIYSFLNDHEMASKCAKIYLDTYENKQTQIDNEALGINSKLSKATLKNEMLLLQNKYKSKKVWFWVAVVMVFIGFFILGRLVFINNRKKKNAEQRIAELIEQYRTLNLDENIEIVPVPKEIIIEENRKSNLSISPEKENEILTKLKALEEKKFYLNPEFTQQTVAKKIKTNTSYLSLVVNKYYNKTFSDYSNELRINYSINEMIKNPTYRKYSTQAIAESVGFKNAISFTKSFNKRTGVTPAQFIKGLDKIT